MTVTVREHEISSGPVDVVDARGRLRREAVGWSRHPVHRWNVRGRWGRQKRWEYWCVADGERLLAVTVADLDAFGAGGVTFLDCATRELVEKLAARPLGLAGPLPDMPHGGDAGFDGMGLFVELRVEPAGTRIAVESRRIRADVVVDRPPAHDTLNVLVPRSETIFQLTSKQFALPARGTVTVDGRAFRFDGAFACLDFGRGIWPYRTLWNWGCAAGVQGGRTVGLNLGGRWTDGTPSTENGILVDGRLHKIGDAVEFEYDRRSPGGAWRVRGPGVDLRFVPSYHRRQKLNLGIIAADNFWCLGRYDGTVAVDGAPLAIDGLRGWAEEGRIRW